MENNNPNLTFTLKTRPFEAERSGEGIVHSSYGDIIIDLKDGGVIEVISDERDWKQWAEGITCFDIKEYEEFYNLNGEVEFDILDVEYWRGGLRVLPNENIRKNNVRAIEEYRIQEAEEI